MNKQQELELAKYLRELADKLSKGEQEWIEWVRGSLTGIAQMLELTNKDEEREIVVGKEIECLNCGVTQARIIMTEVKCLKGKDHQYEK